MAAPLYQYCQKLTHGCTTVSVLSEVDTWLHHCIPQPEQTGTLSM